MGRIEAEIARWREAIAGKMRTGEVSQAKYDELSKQADLDIPMHARFQELKSAYAGTVLTADEAQMLYMTLGNTPDHFNRQDLATKVVLLNLYKELLGISMRTRRRAV